jgi:hypothetical protein
MCGELTLSKKKIKIPSWSACPARNAAGGIKGVVYTCSLSDNAGLNTREAH